jgi:hypothetical protein
MGGGWVCLWKIDGLVKVIPYMLPWQERNIICISIAVIWSTYFHYPRCQNLRRRRGKKGKKKQSKRKIGKTIPSQPNLLDERQDDLHKLENGLDSVATAEESNATTHILKNPVEAFDDSSSSCSSLAKKSGDQVAAEEECSH